MQTAKLFKNGGSQAVRLPKDCRFKDSEVYVHRIGDVVILLPKSDPWAPLLRSLGKFSDDFMNERNQGEFEKREPL